MDTKVRQWSKCDWSFVHIGASACTFMVGLTLWLQFQPMLAPFDEVLGASAVIENGTLSATYRMEVFGRYPVTFTRRVYNRETGAYSRPTVHEAATGRLGVFDLPVKVALPENPDPGTWCLSIEATINYNWFRSAVSRHYAPVCAELKE